MTSRRRWAPASTRPASVAVVLGTGEVVGAPASDGRCATSSGLLETHAYPGGAFFIENPGLALRRRGHLALPAAEHPRPRDAECAGGRGAGRRRRPHLPPGPDRRDGAGMAAGGTRLLLRPDAGAWARAHGPRGARRLRLRHARRGRPAGPDGRRERSSLLLLGGGAHSRLWAQMRADIVQRPVELPHCIDSAPIGAACWPRSPAAWRAIWRKRSARCPTVTPTIAPDRRQADAYDDAYGRYRQLFGALRRCSPNNQETDKTKGTLPGW